MQNALQIVPASSLPTNAESPTFVQNGERSTQIHNEGQLNINNTIVIAGGGVNSSTSGDAVIAMFNAYLANKSDEYYNLFVTNYEGWENGQFFVMPDRALTQETYIQPDIKRLFASLGNDAIERIKTFPSLFMAENIIHSGRQIDPSQVVYYGFVTDVAIQQTGIKIVYQKLAQFSQQGLNQMWRELDIQCPNGYGELTRNHWSIKKINLLVELKCAGLIPAQY